ncbi:MAG: GNAT family N-acetyltransferase [Cyclobacteriaceae bacterium]|nr:GNAT family N-acetyltransferase [Cyclobacteriaceae bacterium]
MPDASFIFKTDRLVLRKLSLDDATFILELVNTPGWLKYIGDRNVHSIEDARAYLGNGPLKSYRENGFGLWKVELSGQPIGMCGILKRAELNLPDLGFAFLPAYKGLGYAHEAVAATLSYACEVLRLSKLSAIVQADNARSIALLKNNGFVRVGNFSFPGKEEVLELYETN